MDATILNITCTSADTQYSAEIPNDTRAISIQCRTAYDVRIAFETGKVATPTAPYATVKSGWVYYDPNIHAIRQTLYVASAQAGVVVEVICWR